MEGDEAERAFALERFRSYLRLLAEARFVEVAGSQAVLEREDGERIRVEIKRLTAEDQKYLARQQPEHQGEPLSHWIALSRRPEGRK
jgi:hypothetical protein